MSKHRQLWEMIREDVRRQFDYSRFVLPDEWAKEWPKDVTNFRIDNKGVYWQYWAGEVYAGCNGQVVVHFSWEQLRPLLRADFIMPTK